MPNKTNFVLFLLFLCGCATARYDLNISSQYTNYAEPINNGNANPSNSAATYKSDGAGIQIGLIETSWLVHAELGGLYASHVNQTIPFYNLGTPVNEEVQLSRYGGYIKLGLNIWWLRPYYTKTYLKNNFRTSNPSLLEQLNHKDGGTLNADGWGLALIIPISESISFMASYEALEAQGFNNLGGVDSRSFNYGDTISLGITIYLGTIKGWPQGEESVTWP